MIIPRYYGLTITSAISNKFAFASSALDILI